MSQVNQGDVVRVHYTGRLADGTVFGSSEERDPLVFVAGEGNVIRGVAEAVVGMSEGEKKTVTIPPEDGFGQRDPALEQTVPRSQLPDQVKEGDQLQAVQGDREIPIWVRELSEESALVDANHPLAGQTLEFDLELVSVEGAGV
jgi:FKBP-type peptidyl-prolyl cis-trans isomerase 2